MALGLVIAAIAILAGVAWTDVKTAGEPGPNFYRGKTIVLTVGFGVGGGYDAYARLLAPFLAEFTGARVRVRNVPGAGGLVAVNRVMRAGGDGLALVLANAATAVLAQRLNDEAVRYDLAKMRWLAGIVYERKVLLLRRDVRLADFANANARAPLRWGGGGKSDALLVAAAALSEALGLNAKIILGFKGSRSSTAAILRRELDGLILSAGSAAKTARLKEIVPVMTLARNRSPLLPDVPTIFERFSLDGQKARWIDLVAELATLGRALLAPPDTPEPVVTLLRSALKSILLDPRFIAAAQAKKRHLAYRPGREIKNIAAAFLKSAGAIEPALLRHVIMRKYY